MIGTAPLLNKLIFTIVLVLGSVCQSVAHADTAFTVQQPDRDFGYQIGDVLVQRIFNVAYTEELAESGLRDGMRVNAYLQRSPLLQQSGRNDAEQWQHWLELHYQIINVPVKTTVTEIPALNVETSDGASITIPAWSFSVSPLLTEDATAENTQLIKPDRSALDTIPLYRSSPFKKSLLVLAALLVLWLLWWLYRHFRDQHVMPFARARKVIVRMNAQDPQHNTEGWVALHRAFNATAGKSINQATVDDLIACAPWLEPLRSSIDDFYRISASRFYQQSNQAESLDIRRLSDALHRREKVHADPGHH